MHVISGLLWETGVVRTLKDTLGDLEIGLRKGWRILESMDLLNLQPEANGGRYCLWQWERNIYTWLSADPQRFWSLPVVHCAGSSRYPYHGFGRTLFRSRELCNIPNVLFNKSPVLLNWVHFELDPRELQPRIAWRHHRTKFQTFHQMQASEARLT